MMMMMMLMIFHYYYTITTGVLTPTKLLLILLLLFLLFFENCSRTFSNSFPYPFPFPFPFFSFPSFLPFSFNICNNYSDTTLLLLPHDMMTSEDSLRRRSISESVSDELLWIASASGCRKWIAAMRCREEYCRAKTGIIIVILRY